MRRIAYSVAFTLIAASLVLGGAPIATYAAEPLPPGPVDEIMGVPGQVKKSLGTGSPMGDRMAMDLLRFMSGKSTSTPVELPPVGKPITPVGPIARTPTAGALGGAATAAFMGGWMLTDGTLALYGATTGNEPLGNVCGMADWFQAAVDVLYMFSAPDCNAVISYANADVTTVETVTYAGVSGAVVGTKRIPEGWGYRDVRCVVSSGDLPSGYTYALFKVSGDTPLGWASYSGGSTGYIGSCSSSFPGANRAFYTKTFVTSTGFSEVYGAFGVQRVADGVIVAQSAVGSSNPNRRVDCKLTWPGGSTTTASAPATYTETTGLSPRSISTVCNDAFVSKPGHGPTLLPTEIEVGSTNQETGSRQIMTEQTVPEFTPDEQKGLTVGNGRGLVLEKVVDGVTRSCMTWEADCVGWWTATSNGTQPAVGTDTYRCTYGGAEIGLAECGAYRNTFDTQTANPTITDPITGQPVPWSTGAPGWSTITPTVTGGGGCGAAFSFNPADWVINPLKCLFIPSTASVTGMQNAIATGWANTGPAKIANLIGGFGFTTPGSGCSGITVDIPWFGHDLGAQKLLNACPGEPLHPIAVGVSWVIGIGFGLGALFAVSRAFGFITGARGVGEGA